MTLTHTGWRRVIVVLSLLYVTGITWWSYSAQTTSRAQRRHDLCVRDQKTYDGALSAPDATLQALAEVLHGTPDQLRQATDAAHRIVLTKLGDRPVCP